MTSVHYHDKHGYLLEMHEIDERGGIVKKTIINSDKRGNQLSRSSFKQDSLLFTILQTFDRYSNVLTTQRLNSGRPPGEIHVYRYMYDKHNNWTKRFEVTGNKETLIEEQVIEYY